MGDIVITSTNINAIHKYTGTEINAVTKSCFDPVVRATLKEHRLCQYVHNIYSERGKDGLTEIADFIKRGNRQSIIPKGMRGSEHAVQLIEELEDRQAFRYSEVRGTRVLLDAVGFFGGREKSFKKLMADGSLKKFKTRPGLNTYEAKCGLRANTESWKIAMFQIRQATLDCYPENVNLYVSKGYQITPEMFNEVSNIGANVLVSDFDMDDIDRRIYNLQREYLLELIKYNAKFEGKKLGMPVNVAASILQERFSTLRPY